MKFKFDEIRLIAEGLNDILKKELPSKPAYWLARFLDKVNSEMKDFEKERMKLVTKHSKKDKDGKPSMKKDNKGKITNEADIANMDAFGKEYSELIEKEFDIDFKPIKLEQFGDTKLTPFVLVKLGKIIEE